MTPNDLTHEEIERMRALVNRADQASKPQEFDLNNPPRAVYVHQAYPKCIYDHASGASKVIRNAQEEQAHLEAGWHSSPVPVEVETDPELDAATAAEAAEIDSRLVKRVRK